jgi:16S rRNA G966 N2-methylase RsmD
MQLFSLLSYFWYIGIRWNWRVAFYLMRDGVSGEKKYGIHTTGADELNHLAKEGKSKKHATIYMPIAYSLLEDLLQQIPSPTRTHFLDIGAGKGRAVAVAAHQHFKKSTGIEFSEKLCQTARKNIQITHQQIPSCQLQIDCSDAAQYVIPTDVDCIFMFNPFDEVIMKKVIVNILDSLAKHNRNLYVIYANPQHKGLFVEQGFNEVFFTKKLKYIEACILLYQTV